MYVRVGGGAAGFRNNRVTIVNIPTKSHTHTRAAESHYIALIVTHSDDVCINSRLMCIDAWCQSGFTFFVFGCMRTISHLGDSHTSTIKKANLCSMFVCVALCGRSRSTFEREIEISECVTFADVMRRRRHCLCLGGSSRQRTAIIVCICVRDLCVCVWIVVTYRQGNAW